MSALRLAAAYAALADAGGDPLDIGLFDRACVLVDTAFGLVQNGGFERFFGSDFPGQPHYAEFSDAFERVGLVEFAGRFREAVDAFPFPDPHLDVKRRRDLLASSSELASQIAALNVEAWTIEDLDEKLQRVSHEA